LSVLGELERAEPYFEEARAEFEHSGRIPCVAICDYDRALALTRAGQANGLVHLDKAQANFDALGMTSWSERSRQLRSSLSGETQARPADLTARELEILRLLAQGHTNKVIAAQLFISVPTVERHIANVYAKIGQRGRAAATAYAIRRGLV
jgi:DNA-binding NarL/FixJ family response regulator